MGIRLSGGDGNGRDIGENLDEIAWYAENERRRRIRSGGKEAESPGACTICWGMSGSGARRMDDNDYDNEVATTASAPRVIRGGSWNNVARYVRAACRNLDEPSHRYDYLGFRFCEFGEPSVVSQAGGEAERARERGAGGRSPRRPRPSERSGARPQRRFFRTRRASRRRSRR